MIDPHPEGVSPEIRRQLRQLAEQVIYNNPKYTERVEQLMLELVSAAYAEGHQAGRQEYQQAFACCELHTPDKWEGDGTCVICEAVALAAKETP